MADHNEREAALPQPLRLSRAVVAAAWRCVPRTLGRPERRRPADLRGEAGGRTAPHSDDGGVWLLIARGLTCLNDPRGHTGGPHD
jgi:hypothetical protein